MSGGWGNARGLPESPMIKSFTNTSYALPPAVAAAFGSDLPLISLRKEEKKCVYFGGGSCWTKDGCMDKTIKQIYDQQSPFD